MNKSEEKINEVMSLIVREYSVQSLPITRQDIVGKSKEQHICRARCLFACTLHDIGYSVKLIAKELNRSEQAIGDMFVSRRRYRESWDYRYVEELCKSAFCIDIKQMRK